MQLTARDTEIIRHVARHRFLNSAQIAFLVDGSLPRVSRRLQLLFHHGYLDRPSAQLRYFAEGGSQPIAYAVGRAGARVMASSTGRRLRWDNRTVKQLYLRHTLLVADIMLEFEKACRSPDAPKLLMEEDLSPGESPSVAFKWTVTVRHDQETKRVGVFPDRVFALESRSTGDRTLFFVEADCGTMPVERTSLSQSSIMRKLLAYEATWAQSIHRTRFNCHRFRVLFVTLNPDRVQHMAEACSRLTSGRGLFLFTDADTLRGHVVPHIGRNIFALPWLNARGTIERLR